MRIPFILSGCLLVVLVFLMNTTVQQQTGLINTGIPAVRSYDYMMKGLDYTQYDAAGMPDYRIVADSITHFPAPEYDALVSPRFEIYQEDKSPWTISAREGRSERDAVRDEQRLDLKNSVVINGADSRGREMQIYTDTLTVYPDSSNVATSSQVRVMGENSELTGTGLSANLNTSKIQLLANVRGHYESQAE